MGDEGENKLVGLNPGRAKRDIDNINHAIVEVLNKYKSICTSFYEGLSKEWFSTNAVDFYEKTSGGIIELSQKIAQNGDDIIDKLVNAFGIISRAHGSGGTSAEHGPFNVIDDLPKLETKSSDGDVGMKVTSVTDLTKSFVQEVEQVKDSLSGIPKSIAFFDTEGKVAGSCATQIDALKNMIDDTLNDIIVKISIAIVEESQKVEKGASSAASVLQ